MKAHPIKRRQTRLESLKDLYEQRCAREAAELQRRLREAFYARQQG